MFDNFGMNIYALKGHKVKATSLNQGYQYHIENAEKYLKLDQIYTVDRTEVASSKTEVYLQEFPDIPFNSTMFEDLVPQSTEDDKKHPDYYEFNDE